MLTVELLPALCISFFLPSPFYVVMNQFVMKLDNRCEKTKKSGAGSTVKRERHQGLPSTSSPPASLPSWMIDPSYKITPATSVTTVCVRESSLDDPSQDNSAGQWSGGRTGTDGGIGCHLNPVAMSV